MSEKPKKKTRKTNEVAEDAYWAKVARQRMATFDRQKALTHEQVWGHLKKRRR